MSKLLFTSRAWTTDALERTWEAIDKIARTKYGLDYFEPQFEIVTAQQMIHHVSTSGIPYTYDHWSFGKSFEQTNKDYVEGKTGVAYEMIINSNPAVCYIMENNSMTIQASVIAHAAVGHSSFFKNNLLFKQWTHPESILMYSRFARNYVKDCEEKYGAQRVERILDAAHALSNIGVDRYERIRTRRKEELAKLAVDRKAYEEMMHNPLWKTFDTWKKERESSGLRDKLNKLLPPTSGFPWPFPEENILYFIEKNAPALEEWERELIHIVRRFAQYFYPQYQTKVMNEGWASFWHHTLMYDLYDEGYISDGNMLEALTSHAGLINHPVDAPIIGHINPYTLGFKMFKKIRQVCENPTEKDKKEFKLIAGEPWLDVVKDIVENYHDSSFLGQFLSSETMEELKMFQYVEFNNQYGRAFKIANIQETDRLSYMRQALSDMYSWSSYMPTIEVVDYDFKDSRTLYLKHQPTKGMALDASTFKDCYKYIQKLWGYPVSLATVNSEGENVTFVRNFM